MADPVRLSGDSGFRRLFDKAPDAIIIYNPDNTFDYVNPAAARLLGYTRKGVMAKKVHEFLLPAEKDRLETVKENRKHGDKSLVEWRALRSDNIIINLEAKSVFLDERQQWLSFLRDITERKQMQTKLQKSQVKEQVLKTKTRILEKQRQDLITLNKAKNEFIMLASHRLRTPATSVKQYVAMLMDGYFGEVTPKQKEILKTAYEANERQMQVVNSLLLTAEFDSGQAKVLRYRQDIVKPIKELVAEIKPTLAEKNQSIKLKLPKNNLINCDIYLLKTALSHLINNASQYSQKGKLITLELVKKKDRVLITVADQGVGIRQRDHKLLFQKFTRIPNRLTDTVDGNGLGLYLVKQIVESHGGDISIDSHLNKGTTFSLSIPIKAIK
ncbi:MAG TPA: PAS domain-containing sensor histidine kinase [Candidatus Saccharimonadales bacterium]|nr:PAS domain-containing sensor histidine kinase [Candidatus Saccharimonadales bacterium]